MVGGIAPGNRGLARCRTHPVVDDADSCSAAGCTSCMCNDLARAIDHTGSNAHPDWVRQRTEEDSEASLQLRIDRQ